MKKFLSEILFCFFLPALFIAVVSEYSLRQIPNDYIYKNQWMEENSKKIDVLCLGPSSIYYGIDPTYFSISAFNGSHVSQSLNYDNFIFNKFIDKMAFLQYLVLEIDYWSPFYSLQSGPEWWRAKYYSIYYGCDYHKGETKYNYELATHTRGTFKNAARGFLTAIGLRHDSNINVNRLGFGLNFSTLNKQLDWDNGKDSALRHTREIKAIEHLNQIDKNREFVNDICKKCADRNIEVLLISTPTCKSYRAYLDSDFLKKKVDFCNLFVESFNNVSYVDFSSDKRFVDEDFYDAYHLNEIGARKLTTILNTKILEWK
jgi:hypothetical protein